MVKRPRELEFLYLSDRKLDMCFDLRVDPLISHYRFEKLFSRGFWLVGLILFAGSYILFFIIAVIMYACSGGEIIEGENATGVVFFQLLFGSYLFYFTIAYLISFICRLIKSGRNKSKKERGDDSCQ